MILGWKCKRKTVFGEVSKILGRSLGLLRHFLLHFVFYILRVLEHRILQHTWWDFDIFDNYHNSRKKLKTFNLLSSDNHPYLTGRGLQSPGLSFVPNLDINDHQDHIFNRLHDVNTKAAAVYKNDGEEYKKYVSAIDQYFSENDIDTSKFGVECGVSL